jgi:hypothetical protein
MFSATNFGGSVKRTVRLSIESANGRHRRVTVEIDRSPSDSDAKVMEKASAAYRQKRGFQSRIVAIYV